MIEIPTIRQVIKQHQKSIDRYGGGPLILDENKIESALKSMYDPSLGVPEVCAKISFRIISNHPFQDGNKRTALFTLLLMLKKNGHKYNGRKKDLEEIIKKLADGKETEEGYMAFIFHHTEKL
ncbi:MAG: type II toxin-antitoxin system death-on-curing family toxin [Leptospiraceae bacterium]|nr:type II toxin-antitoxin system death-on-curing family toxin [Leptospiraceae bacterium]MCP5501569.1 type II toxin-antitoxin system death-on-curing family toxin [Leptospiraceae bacterium]